MIGKVYITRGNKNPAGELLDRFVEFRIFVD
jgi:hypothetical protein